MPTIPAFFALLCLTGVATTPIQQQTPDTAPTIEVTGDVNTPLTLTNAQIRERFAPDVKTIRYTLKKEKAKAHAVPLLRLIEIAQPKTDPKRKNALLGFSVIVIGEDGYTMTFGMGELTLADLKHTIFVALDKNDKPYSAKEMPATLVVPGDLKPSRWVIRIKTIRLVDATKS